MEGFKEISIYDRKYKSPENKKEQFIENPIGANYMKLEFERMPEINANRAIKFTEKR